MINWCRHFSSCFNPRYHLCWLDSKHFIATFCTSHSSLIILTLSWMSLNPRYLANVIFIAQPTQASGKISSITKCAACRADSGSGPWSLCPSTERCDGKQHVDSEHEWLWNDMNGIEWMIIWMDHDHLFGETVLPGVQDSPQHSPQFVGSLVSPERSMKNMKINRRVCVALSCKHSTESQERIQEIQGHQQENHEPEWRKTSNQSDDA